MDRFYGQSGLLFVPSLVCIQPLRLWFLGFSLNTAIVLSVSMLINNPWTMVPVYYIDYQAGVALLSLFSPEQQVFIKSNPQVLQAVLTYIKQYLPFADFSLFVFTRRTLCIALCDYLCAFYICYFCSFKESLSLL